ncbi:cytochrome c biogenesis protein ResB [Fervidibacillus halotolerans]|uniref:Cytochrome c biogenesis protein ResB n=1 Tax=Fervidibacillus halotolerans TaxID=2980027 RepID=A0A9E8RYG6_9BACI|nr:cytochrome c biogenesis protein ResB [Fervidibacillus halotolerans]WAA13800.1 cytochrome c biogenesis protein ResB [Fervidibacillus halotolerans]
MKEIKCECGHVNPNGTVLCESCGKVLDEKQQQPILDMRYEGTARRSQTYKRTIIDKIWNFFSSVKVGVALIIITLIVSALGTIFPQEKHLSLTVPAEIYYKERYGWFGKVYYALGFHDLYGSLWYELLIASIGVSLVICSLDRAIPLYRALKKQKPKKHVSFLKRQRLFAETDLHDADEKDTFNLLKERLVNKRYRIMEDGENLLAEKGRFSRWGPYVNHIGLIIVLIGVMLRSVPGFYVDEWMMIKEGETKTIPGTDKQYYLTNHQFLIETYDENDNEAYKEALENQGAIVKNYQSNVTLYKASESLPGEEPKLTKLKDYEIRVNEPLTFDGFSIYQMTYKNELKSMTFGLMEKDTNEIFGQVTIDLDGPKRIYDLGNGYQVEILSYFPDFEFSNGEPSTKSGDPNNPAFAFKMITPDKRDGELSFTSIQQTIEPFGENKYKMVFQGADTVYYSGLTVRKNETLWILALGGTIFLIGVIQGSFWYHRRIWVKVVDNRFYIAGHTNKNWFGFQKEIDEIVDGTGLPFLIDQSKKSREKVNEG